MQINSMCAIKFQDGIKMENKTSHELNKNSRGKWKCCIKNECWSLRQQTDLKGPRFWVFFALASSQSFRTCNRCALTLTFSQVGELCWKLKMSQWPMQTSYFIWLIFWVNIVIINSLPFWLQIGFFSIRRLNPSPMIAWAAVKSWMELPVSGDWPSVSVVPVVPCGFNEAGHPARALCLCILWSADSVQLTLWQTVRHCEI